MPEIIKPMDIEKRSFEIITELLGDRKLDSENELVIKRVIHTPRISITRTTWYSPSTQCVRASKPCGPAATW